MIIFDEAEKQNAIETTNVQWEEFRNALIIKGVSYDDTEKVKQETFLNVFDDLFSQTRHIVELDLAEVHSKYSLFRAVKLSPDEIVDYPRFIPDASKGGSDNRFSPKGIEWLYLGLSCVSGNDEDIKTGCIKEVNADSGDNVALCKFEINRKYYKNRKRNYAIDLTVADESSYGEINRDLVKPNLSSQERTTAIHKWIAFTYMKMLSYSIFVPLSNVDLSIEYLPFQCLAKYFERSNLCGIIYRSTVYEKSKNIVLFNKRMASPVGEIEKRKLL